eukprot:Rhum_TRINITY_DN3386_c0_g3::Rhum_TRINITY_DN3386_c0_g3_i1::g.10389::m.10389
MEGALHKATQCYCSMNPALLRASQAARSSTTPSALLNTFAECTASSNAQGRARDSAGARGSKGVATTQPRLRDVGNLLLLALRLLRLLTGGCSLQHGLDLAAPSQLKSTLSLCIREPSHACTRCEQNLHALAAVDHCRAHQSCAVSEPRVVEVHALVSAVHKQPQARHAPPRGSPDVRVSLPVVLQRRVRPRLEQHPHALHGVRVGRVVQRRPPDVVPRVYGHAAAQQQADHLVVARVRCLGQRRPLPRTLALGVGACRQQKRHTLGPRRGLVVVGTQQRRRWCDGTAAVAGLGAAEQAAEQEVAGDLGARHAEGLGHLAAAQLQLADARVHRVVPAERRRERLVRAGVRRVRERRQGRRGVREAQVEGSVRKPGLLGRRSVQVCDGACRRHSDDVGLACKLHVDVHLPSSLSSNGLCPCRCQ